MKTLMSTLFVIAAAAKHGHGRRQTRFLRELEDGRR